jgi:hypothetical protein
MGVDGDSGSGVGSGVDGWNNPGILDESATHESLSLYTENLT